MPTDPDPNDPKWKNRDAEERAPTTSRDPKRAPASQPLEDDVAEKIEKKID